MRSSPVLSLKSLSAAFVCAFLPALEAQDTPMAAPSAEPAAEGTATHSARAPGGVETFSAPVAITGETIIPVTIEDAVQLALGSNFGLRIESYNRTAAQEAVIIAGTDFEPVISANALMSGSADPDPTDATLSNSAEQRSASVSVSQRLGTGATATLSGDLGRSERSGGLARANLFYFSDLSLSLRQPLLAGAGFKVNRVARERARIGVERSGLTFRTEALDVVRDTELAFYNLASAHYTLDVQRSGLTTAQRFLDENEARRSAGLATELDVMQARVSVANRQAQIVTAEQRVREATDQLLALFGRRDFAGILQPVGYAFAPPASLSVERSYGRAVGNDPAILNARAAMRQLELDLVTAENGRLPQLDLQGSLGYTGTDTGLNEPQPDIGGALEDLTRRDIYDWRVGVNLSVPWGMREGHARLRIARSNLEQQKVRLEQLEQLLMVNIRSAVRAIESDKQTVEINALSAELSQREFELEKAKFDNGLSTSRLVVEAQQRWDEAKVRETQSRVQLRQDSARLRRLEGGSLELYGVEPLAR